ncbi:CLM1 protein, partial [Thalassarche chlororhynchos]|nr:CLM1 protein [Thalassarche chlororhynchos]
MGISPGWAWLLLPVCQALVVPREVSSRAGETLSLRCWYPRGYEGYNKYWCQGPSRDSCLKVVETAGREAPRQRGRVSIQDSHLFCVVLLTVEDLSEADAGSYWCGIERMGRDLMESVTVRVVPGKPWCLAGWRCGGPTVTSSPQFPPGPFIMQLYQLPWQLHRPPSPPGSPPPRRSIPPPTPPLPQEGLWEGTSTQGTVKAKPQPCEGENKPCSSTLAASPGGPALSALVPSAVLLSLLVAAG